jgi:hypothetical protein
MPVSVYQQNISTKFYCNLRRLEVYFRLVGEAACGMPVSRVAAATCVTVVSRLLERHFHTCHSRLIQYYKETLV